VLTRQSGRYEPSVGKPRSSCSRSPSIRTRPPPNVHSASPSRSSSPPGASAASAPPSPSGSTSPPGQPPPPVQAFPSSIFSDKKRCDIGKSQSKDTAKVGHAWRSTAEQDVRFHAGAVDLHAVQATAARQQQHRLSAGAPVQDAVPWLQSQRLVIESRWVSKPLAFAG
jgi:hypothetical protein